MKVLLFFIGWCLLFALIKAPLFLPARWLGGRG